MHPAIFLDRDGVIIENRPDYVRNWQDVQFFPFALTALERIKDSAYKIVLVTNQSAVGRGIMSLAAAQTINQRLVLEIQQAGGRIDGVYMCPHAPADGCLCRKPKPGLLLQAAQALSIDLGRSIMIGDAWSDVLAGQAAGVRQAILVETGRGARQLAAGKPEEVGEFLVYKTIADVLADLI